MLELLAMMTMLVDHIGVAFWPELLILRIIGRIAMPIYVYLVAVGFRRTKSRSRYALRLALVALTAQPFYMSLPSSGLNIVVGLLGGLGVLALIERWPRYQALVILCAAPVYFFVPVDYGIYLLALLLVYWYSERPWILLMAHASLNVVIVGLGTQWIQMFSLFATLLIVSGPYPAFPKSFRWFYRAFYPAHLAVLMGVKLWFAYSCMRS